MDWLAINFLREVAEKLFHLSLQLRLQLRLQLFQLLQRLQLLQILLLMLLLLQPRMDTHDIPRVHCLKSARLFQWLLHLDVFHNSRGFLKTYLRRACVRRTDDAGDDLRLRCEMQGIIDINRGGERVGEVEKSATLVANERLACHVAEESCSEKHKVIVH